MSLIRLIRENKIHKSYDDIKNFSNALNRSKIVQFEDVHELPIATNKKSDWSLLEDPERIQKIFSFDSMKEVLYFVDDMCKYQFDINHHCRIIIDGLDVTIETYTHGFDGVTESDMKIKKASDDLYNEINYFKRNQ